MFSGLAASITSAAVEARLVVSRAKMAMSPIQLKTSRSRSMPYC